MSGQGDAKYATPPAASNTPTLAIRSLREHSKVLGGILLVKGEPMKIAEALALSRRTFSLASLWTFLVVAIGSRLFGGRARNWLLNRSNDG